MKTGWSQLDQVLGYKYRAVIKVEAAYASQQCYACGHTESGNWRRKANSSVWLVAVRT